MAFNGSGAYQRIHSWVADRDAAVKITASRMDAEDDSFATGLSSVICKDGQTTTTARIPLALGVGLGDGSVSAPAVNFTSETGSGLYRIGSSNVGLAIAGTKIIDIAAAGVGITGTFTASGTSTLAAVSATTGAFSSTLAATGNFSVNTNKFNVTASSGDTTVAGTLGVTGASTLAAVSATTGSFSSTLAATGNFAVNTNKFNVTASSGDTTIAGTLGVTGASTFAAVSGTTGSFSSTLSVTGNFAINTNKFNVTASSGNTTIAGTLNVTGAITGSLTGHASLDVQLSGGQNLTGGFTTTSYNAGTKSSGTFTPDPANGNIQHATNGGAHTLDPPSSVTTMIIEYVNNASAGTITTSGFTLVSGDSLTTTNGHKFLMQITKSNSYSHLNVQALQ